jgi:hypothetical protein
MADNAFGLLSHRKLLCKSRIFLDVERQRRASPVYLSLSAGEFYDSGRMINKANIELIFPSSPAIACAHIHAETEFAVLHKFESN